MFFGKNDQLLQYYKSTQEYNSSVILFIQHVGPCVISNIKRNSMLSNVIGITHLITSIIALIAGSLVLKNSKGTKTHKKIGYVYTIAMAIVLLTSFMIYRLHGSFGMLHWFAVVSSITLMAGMVPILLKKPNNYLSLHFSFMYWSVIELYCAFFAEVLTHAYHFY